MQEEEYTEVLPCGGMLCVNSFERYIRFYFPGPDRRYNGTFLRVWISDLPEYIIAYQKNWERYCDLKNTVPHGGSFRVNGACDMVIFIGTPFDGISLEGHHMILNTLQEINVVIESFKYAINRSEEIRNSMFGRPSVTTPPATTAHSADTRSGIARGTATPMAPPEGQLKYDLTDSRRLFDFMDAESVLSATKRAHDIEYLTKFIDAGASLSFRSPHMQCTPLHLAARYQNRDIVVLLVSKGADITATDKNGRTPLDYAKQAEQEDVVDFLINSSMTSES